MNYKKYTRKFIMLKDESDGNAKGYVRIETGNNKGAIRCQVEELQPRDAESLYKLVFVGQREEEILNVTIGTLTINNIGKGENYFRFLPYNLDGKGNELMDFDTILVVSQSRAQKSDDAGELKVLLKGSIEEKKHLENESTENNNRKNSVNNHIKEEFVTFNEFYNKFLLNACIHICQTAESFVDIEPFAEDETGAAWKRISNVTNLPIISPGAHYFSTRYKHYIFGAKEVGKEKTLDFYIGIPGRNLPEEQPDGGDSGFQFWQPLKGQDQQYGYWIVRIKGEGGHITTI